MDWDTISKDPYLSIEFLQEHQENLNWMDISLHIFLTKEILETFQNKLLWTCMAVNPSLTCSLLEETKDFDYVDWKIISQVYPITLDFYDQFDAYLDKEKIKLNPVRKIEITTEHITLADGNVQKKTTITEKAYPLFQSYINNIPTSKRALEAKMESRKKI